MSICKKCIQCHLRKRVIAESLNERSLSNGSVAHSNHGHLWGPRHPPPQPACHSPACQFSCLLIQLPAIHLPLPIQSTLRQLSVTSQLTLGPAAINSVNRKGQQQLHRLLKYHQVHQEGSPTSTSSRQLVTEKSLAWSCRERNVRASPPPPSLTAGAG